MTSKLSYGLVAMLPLLATPQLVYLLADGWLDFGGGEKDILLAIPYVLWSLIFFVAALVLIIRGRPFHQWLIRAGLMSLLVLMLLWIAALAFSLLGMA